MGIIQRWRMGFSCKSNSTNKGHSEVETREDKEVNW